MCYTYDGVIQAKEHRVAMVAMMPTTVVYIGENLKRVRMSRMLSQRDLATKARLSPTTIAKLETNKSEVRPSTLRKLVEALNADPSELIGD